VARGEEQDRGKVTAQHDRQFDLVGHERYLIAQRPENLSRLGLAVLAPQALIERRNPTAVYLRHIRMRKRWRLLCIGEPIVQLSLSSLKPLHVIDDGLDGTPSLDIALNSFASSRSMRGSSSRIAVRSALRSIRSRFTSRVNSSQNSLNSSGSIRRTPVDKVGINYLKLIHGDQGLTIHSKIPSLAMSGLLGALRAPSIRAPSS
jgi:hypothetical protein